MDSVTAEVSLIRANLPKINARVKEVEETMINLKADTTILKKQVSDLQATSRTLEAKYDDYEGRSRRNNVRIIGVPKWAEGPAADLFMEDLGVH